ncbi:MAG: DNA-3-methyladenine glycosylase 2 family protein [Fimbriimonadaceae bacterium]|nr:DNA-3-methyladenine glycosylase 2 family protein [Fimbriimonadaceae bacterium]
MDHNEALNHLRQFSPFDELIAQHGPPEWNPTRDPFLALAGTLVYQQLSGAAARTIWGRFEKLFPNEKPCPRHLAELSDEDLRSAGVSRQKAGYLRSLAEAYNSGRIPLDFRDLSDDEIRALLIPVKGIGEWTVDMFLMFDLGRLDVWPTGDLGIQKGVAILNGCPLKPREMGPIAEPWRPYRSVAAWYLWRLLETPIGKDLD